MAVTGLYLWHYDTFISNSFDAEYLMKGTSPWTFNYKHDGHLELENGYCLPYLGEINFLYLAKCIGKPVLNTEYTKNAEHENVYKKQVYKFLQKS